MLQELLVYGKQFGNVFIGVQPTFGYEGDPMRLLFSRSASPHHGFAAYYTYLEKIFGVRFGGLSCLFICMLGCSCGPLGIHAGCRHLSSPTWPPTPTRCRLTRCCTLALTAPWSSCPASR